MINPETKAYKKVKNAVSFEKNISASLLSLPWEISLSIIDSI